MKRDWTSDEIVEYFTLLPAEIEFLGSNDPHNSTIPVSFETIVFWLELVSISVTKTRMMSRFGTAWELPCLPLAGKGRGC